MAQTETKIEKITDLKPNLHNPNRGTLRGRAMLERALTKHGWAGAMTVDRNGVVIDGNQRLDVLAGGESPNPDEDIPIVVVKTDGRQVVVVQRTDLDLNDVDNPARLMTYEINRIAEVNYDLSPEQLAEDVSSGLNLEGLFHGQELDRLLGALAEHEAPLEQWNPSDEPGIDDEELPAVATDRVRFEFGGLSASLPAELYDKFFHAVVEAGGVEIFLCRVLGI